MPAPHMHNLHSTRFIAPVTGAELTDEDPFASAGGSMLDVPPEDDDVATGEPGSVLEVKHLDEVLEPLTGRWDVKPTPRGGDLNSKKRDKYDAYAFTVIRRFSPAGPVGGRANGMQMTYSVTKMLNIQSPELAKVGAEVIGHVQGVSWTAKPLRVSPALQVASYVAEILQLNLARSIPKSC